MANPNFGEAAYRAAARPAPKPKPKKKPVAKVQVSQPVKAASGTSAAQQIVNAALAPLLANIKSQETALGTTQAGQQAALQGYTKQILDYLKGAPAQIQSDYQGAVDSTQNLAQASADQLLKSNPNSLNQADLAAINAPQAQRDALAAQNQNVYGGGSATLFKTAGAIPATAFAQDEAARKAFADSLPTITGLQGQQLFAKLLATQNEDTQKLAAQKAEVLAKAPGLLQQAQNSLAPSSKAPTVKKIGDGYYQWDAGKGWTLLAKAKSTDRTGQVKLANGQYVTTLNGTPVGNPWGPVKAASGKSGSSVPHTTTFNGKKWQWNGSGWDLLGKSGSSTSGAGTSSNGHYVGGTGAYSVLNGLTTSAAAKKKLDWYETALNSAHDAFNGLYDKQGNLIDGSKRNYQQALTDLTNHGIPLDIAQRGLNKYWKKPGQGGRPLKSFQERNPQANPKNASFTSGGASSAVNWATDLLTRGGFPVTPQNIQNLISWSAKENTNARWNPLATIDRMPGSTAFNSNGGFPVQHYTSYEQGLAANLKHLMEHGGPILTALRRGNLSVQQFAAAVAADGWGSGTFAQAPQGYVSPALSYGSNV